MPDPQYPSAAGVSASPFNRGPMTSVEGDYASSASAGPSAFGGNVDLASAFEGTLSDMRAVAQQTVKTLSDIGIMAQRISSMLGGTGGSGDGITALPVPNQLPPSPFGSHTSSANITAAISQATGASYGSAANATPQFNLSYASLPPEITNPSFASLPSSATAQPVPSQNSASLADHSSTWEPATQQEESHASDIQRIKHLTETVLAKEYLDNTGGKQASNLKSITAHPSVRSISASLAGRMHDKYPGWASTTADKPNVPWNDTSPSNRIRLSQQYSAGKLSKADFLKYQVEGIPAETGGLGAGIGTLAESGDLTAAAGATIGGGAMAGIAAVALPVAAVGAAAYLGVKEMESQRATNAAIQSQIGGSNFSAYGTRAQGLGYSLANLGTMGMGMSGEAFTGVTNLGLQGGDRSNALSFIQSNYSNMGMSVSDSMALVAASVKAGSAHLTQLAATLDAVTNSAAAASVNTEQARQGFSSMFQGAISSGMSTSGAATYAGAAQMLTNNLGISGQGAKFMVAPNALAAATMGISIPAYENKISNPVTGGTYGAQAQQNVTKMALAPYLANVADLKHLASMELKNQSGTQSTFASTFRTANNMTNEQLPGILQRAGIDTSAMVLPNGQPDYNGMYSILASQGLHPNQITTAYTKMGAEQSINAKIAQLRPKSGGFGISSWDGYDALKNGTANHQLSSAEANIDRYIGNHTANSKGASIAGSLLANASQLRVSGAGFGPHGALAGQDNETIQAALGDSATFQKLMKGQGTITLADGKKMSIPEFVAKHKMPLTPPTGTSGNNANNSNGTTIGLTPAAAQLVQILPSAAAQAGNTYGTTPPTGVSPNNNAFSG